MDKMREEFEEWAKENYFDIDKIISFTGWSIDEGRYDNSSTQTAWQAWQASRQALIVELPDACDSNAEIGAYSNAVHSALDSADIKWTE